MTTVSLYSGYQPYLHFTSVGGNPPGFEPENNVETTAAPSSTTDYTFQYVFFDVKPALLANPASARASHVGSLALCHYSPRVHRRNGSHDQHGAP